MINASSHFEEDVMSENICSCVVVVGWLVALELLHAGMAWWASQVVPLAVGRGDFTIVSMVCGMSFRCGACCPLSLQLSWYILARQVCLSDEVTFDVLMFHKTCSVGAVAWLVVFSLLHAVQVDDKSHAPMSCLCVCRIAPNVRRDLVSQVRLEDPLHVRT